MKGLFIPVLGLVAALGLAACGGSSSSSGGGDDDMTRVRVLHAATDAPDVRVSVDGEVAIGRLAFGDGSGFLALPAGARDVRVEGLTPEGEVEVFAATLDLAADRVYTIIANGRLSDDSFAPFVADASPEGPGGDQIRLQVAHAASGAPPVDVYVTAVGADLPSSAPVNAEGPLAPGESLAPVTVPAAEYQVRVTAAGDASAVVFDSGPLTLAGGSDLLVAAVDNTGPGDAPIRLVGLGAEEPIKLLSAGTPSGLRAAHLSADAGVVDVVAGTDPAALAAVFEDVPFTAVSPFLAVPPGDYAVNVLAGGMPQLVPDAELSLAAGMRYSAFAVGAVATGSFTLVPSVDDLRSVATHGRLRVLHAAEIAGEVDVYLVPRATPTDRVSEFEPVLAGFAFTELTDFLPLTPGEYEVFVTPADVAVVAITATVVVAPGGVYTAVARPQSNALGLQVIDDTP